MDNSARVYNGISIVFLALTAFITIFVVVSLLGPAPEDEETFDLSLLPQLIQLPTQTPSNTPTATLTPTRTPTPTDTPTPSITPTETPTLAPSATITETPGPTETPSNTPTPSISPTPTATDTPTGPTMTFTPSAVPYYFDISGQVFFSANGVNSAGCAWQGIGGNVVGLDGLEVTQSFQIRVFGHNGFEQITQTGSNTLYGGVSGWGVTVANAIAPTTYYVRLETTFNTPLSPDIQVTFPGDCNGNSAIVRIAQTQPFGPPTPVP